VPQIGTFTNNIGWGESSNVILQVSIAVFCALSKYFSGNDGSALLEKLARTPTTPAGLGSRSDDTTISLACIS